MLAQKTVKRLTHSAIVLIGICCFDDWYHRLGLGITATLSNTEFVACLLGAAIPSYFCPDPMKSRVMKKIIKHFKYSQKNKPKVEENSVT